MKIEKLVFDCVNALEEQKVVTIHVKELKVELEGKQESIGHNLQNLVAIYLELLDQSLQNNADKGQYEDTLFSLARAIVNYVLQIQFCDWQRIDEIKPAITIDLESMFEY